MGITRAAAPTFQLGTTVWSVGVSNSSWGVEGPAKVSAVTTREDSITYRLTWPDGGAYGPKESIIVWTDSAGNGELRWERNWTIPLAAEFYRLSGIAC